jgi:hypothetical protein
MFGIKKSSLLVRIYKVLLAGRHSLLPRGQHFLRSEGHQYEGSYQLAHKENPTEEKWKIKAK